MSQRPNISAIVPTLNEEDFLPRTLVRLRQCGFQVLVVDGGSSDRTVKLAALQAHKVLQGPRGRARQMNLGADHSDGDILFFLHADSLPPLNSPELIRQTLGRPGTVAGSFLLRIDSNKLNIRLISALANCRSRIGQLPWGDQGLYLSRETFKNIGGYNDIPIMEDVDLVRRLKKQGRIALAPDYMTTSDRRWRRRGVWKNTLENQYRLGRYWLGVSPESLARSYPHLR